MIKVIEKTKNQIVLTPRMFSKLLCLPSTNKTLQLSDGYSFMSSQVGGSKVFKYFFLPSENIPTNLSTIDITFLQEPYQDFSWFFACVTGHESTSHIPRSTLYALYFSFPKHSIFEWERSYQMNFFFS
jgi:hypothetical protein